MAIGRKAKTMGSWKRYRKTGIQEARPYVVGEDLTGISVSDGDEPEKGGMIARNPEDHKDQWFIAQKFFDKNYEQVGD